MHLLVERTRDHVRQQLLCCLLVQPCDDELGQLCGVVRLGRLAHREDQPDRLLAQTARDEGELLGRGRVEPLRVIDNAQQRLFLGRVRQQAQDGEANQEPIGRGPAAQPEGRAECVALQARNGVEPIQRRLAQLMQRRERQFLLRVGTGRSHDATSCCVLHEVFQQRALADSCLTTQHQCPARTRTHVRRQPLQRRAFAAPAEQPPMGHCPGSRPGRRVVTSCRVQPLPSGSSNEAYEL